MTVLLEVTWLEGVFGGELTQSSMVAMGIALTTTWLLGLMFAILIREQASWIGRLALTLVLLLLADMLTWQAVWADDGRFPWIANVVTMPVWALALYSVIGATAFARPVEVADRPRREHRRNLLFNVAILLLLVGVGLGMLSRPDLTPIRVLGALIAVAALIVRDLVRSQQTSELLGQLAIESRSDNLTRCGNRLALHERVAALELAAAPIQLLVVDLDGFKHVNTQYGLGVGDRVLREVAHSLQAEVASLGQVFRLGGDEFAVVVPGDSDAADEAADRIHRGVTNAVSRLGDLGTMSLSASVGVASSDPSDPGSPTVQDALALSSHAMTAAKSRGRSRTVRYDDDISRAKARVAAVQARLTHALSAQITSTTPFRVVFQPMYGSGGQILAVEALARWHDDELGEVSPDEFIPIAESTGLIERLGSRVLAMAVQDFARTASPEIGLALNVSTIQLRNPGFAQHLFATLARAQVATERVLVEVTESVLVQQNDPALRTLFQLAGAGFAIAVDDFGSGYSSLGYLGRLPVNVIKLDASLIRQLDQPRAFAIARSVVDMAESLSLGVVAEGIETIEQLDATHGLGINVGQGYLLGRPGPIAEIGAGDCARSPGGSLWAQFIPVAQVANP